MSLINCEECGKEVSSKAVRCPNCGAPVNDPVLKWYQKNSKGNIALMLGCIAFLLICVCVMLILL